jgi:hypothetical protein
MKWKMVKMTTGPNGWYLDGELFKRHINNCVIKRPKKVGTMVYSNGKLFKIKLFHDNRVIGVLLVPKDRISKLYFEKNLGGDV